MTNDLPTAEEILETHDAVEARWDLKYTGTSVPAARLKFQRLLDDIREYDDVYLQAAHLLRDIATAHYFEDGNKRTAWLTMREYLSRHAEEPSVDTAQAEQVMRRLRRYEADEIAIWLEIGEIDEDRLNP